MENEGAGEVEEEEALNEGRYSTGSGISDTNAAIAKTNLMILLPSPSSNTLSHREGVTPPGRRLAKMDQGVSHSERE